MTPESADRLVTCFRTVFPDLSETEIRDASIDSLEKWDSLATVTLVAVIEEEYEIQVPDESLESFVSFESIAQALNSAEAGT